MLNFTKIKILFIYSILIFSIFFALLNLKNNNLMDKKVNLGLDLQGGSYLLLEIDTTPLINQKLQSKVLPLKNLKKNNIDYNNFVVSSTSLSFKMDNNLEKKFDKIFLIKRTILLIALYLNTIHSN